MMNSHSAEYNKRKRSDYHHNNHNNDSYPLKRTRTTTTIDHNNYNNPNRNNNNNNNNHNNSQHTRDVDSDHLSYVQRVESQLKQIQQQQQQQQQSIGNPNNNNNNNNNKNSSNHSKKISSEEDQIRLLREKRRLRIQQLEQQQQQASSSSSLLEKTKEEEKDASIPSLVGTSIDKQTENNKKPLNSVVSNTTTHHNNNNNDNHSINSTSRNRVDNDGDNNAHYNNKRKDKDNMENGSESPLFDMFSSDSPSASSPSTTATTTSNEFTKINRLSGHQQQASSLSSEQQQQHHQQHLSANWDDEEAYYKFSISELIHNDRYRIVGSYGKGVFSVVLKAIDCQQQKNKNEHDDNNDGDGEIVAIKMIRNNESMRKSGLKEIELLKLLVQEDVNDECHCVRIRDFFTYRNHLCIVFDALEMNLRQVVSTFGKVQGKETGIHLDAVQLYTKQLFMALTLLERCGILHADIKPDNIMVVDRTNTQIRLGDFGSACRANENAIMPYLVSRFYRAPEVILGMKYDYAIDVWSVACTVYELYTGKILFPSKSNNHQLKLIMDYKGKIANKMLGKCLLRDHHFDKENRFLYQDTDNATKRTIIRPMMPQKTRDLKTDLLNATLSSEDEAVRRRVVQLADLLEKALTIDPAKRMTARQALGHPFLQ